MTRRGLMGRGRRAFRLVAVLAAAVACLTPTASHAVYPERPITFIVPFAAGGPTDIIARILASALSQTLGQNVIVDNRGGAAGNIGMGIAARATPDGYTLMLTSTALAVNPALFKNLPYDPFRDFIPITELVNAPNVVFVRSDSDIKTLHELIAQAKASPDKFNYASPGAGTKSHLTGELLKLRAGINMVHVPFRGGGPAKTRIAALPDVPTMIELGFPGFVSDTFNALFAPAGTPPDIVAFMAKESRAAMQRPDVRDAARKSGYEIVAGTPEQLAKRLATEIPLVQDLVARTGIKPE